MAVTQPTRVVLQGPQVQLVPAGAGPASQGTALAAGQPVRLVLVAWFAVIVVVVADLVGVASWAVLPQGLLRVGRWVHVHHPGDLRGLALLGTPQGLASPGLRGGWMRFPGSFVQAPGSGAGLPASVLIVLAAGVIMRRGRTLPVLSRGQLGLPRRLAHVLDALAERVLAGQ
jgi:hypothetical protein